MYAALPWLDCLAPLWPWSSCSSPAFPSPRIPVVGVLPHKGFGTAMAWAREENALGHLQARGERTVSKKDLLNFHNLL